MLFEKVTKENILQGIKDYEAKGFPKGFGPSSTYDVVYEGKKYPPKAIMAYANFHAEGRTIENYFKGGEGTDCFKAFERKGFNVVKKQKTVMNEKLHKLKQDFLDYWPIDRLKKMTLDEYTNLEKTSFCYWVEQKTDKLGGMRGGSSYKFGIYKRNAKSKPIKTKNIKTDGTYAWHSKYGSTTNEAFISIKEIIINIASFSINNKLNKLDNIEIGNVFKWKIAFLYSDFKVINIFKLEALEQSANYLGILSKANDYSTLNEFIISQKGERDFFEFSSELWKISNLELEGIKKEFSDWLKSTESSGKIYSYLRAIDILNEILDKDLYLIKNTEELQSLYDDLIIEQKVEGGNYFYEDAPSYGKNGFYSASIKAFIIFLNNKNIKTITIDSNKIYKLSMGTFLKSKAFRDTDLLNQFEENKWAVMGKDTQKGQGDAWINDVKINDYIYITFGHERLSYIARIKSKSKELPNEINTIIGHNEFIYREYEVVREPIINNTKNLVTNKRRWLPSGNSTLVKINNLNAANELLFRPYYKTEFIKSKNSSNDNVDNLVLNENIMQNKILYGPPGTGKTYFLKEQLFYKYTSKQTSITKEQYFETIIKSCTWWQVIAIALLDLKKGKVSNIFEHKWVQKKASLSNSKTIRPTLWGQLQSHTIEECKFVNVSSKQQPLIFNKTEDSHWEILEEEVKELVPELYDLKGDVENYNPDPDKLIKNYDFVTFHQSFAYEDFIEGIKPIFPENEEESKDLGYKIEDGVFKKLCSRAKNDPNNRYAIFIDEINRGNVSAIFGELITLIETDKRKGAVNEMSITLPYSKNEFSVPSNLDIYGTMNTADRSVEALDTALRRRFEFKEMMPDYRVIENENIAGLALSKVLKTINERIELLIDRDHTIGHSYFFEVDTEEKLANAFNNKIVPLLQEYFYGDYGKIGLVLGKGFVEKQKNDKIEFADFSYENANDFKTPSFILKRVSEDTIVEAVSTLLGTKQSSQTE